MPPFKCRDVPSCLLQRLDCSDRPCVEQQFHLRPPLAYPTSAQIRTAIVSGRSRACERRFFFGAAAGSTPQRHRQSPQERSPSEEAPQQATHSTPSAHAQSGHRKRASPEEADTASPALTAVRARPFCTAASALSDARTLKSRASDLAAASLEGRVSPAFGTVSIRSVAAAAAIPHTSPSAQQKCSIVFTRRFPWTLRRSGR